MPFRPCRSTHCRNEAESGRGFTDSSASSDAPERWERTVISGKGLPNVCLREPHTHTRHHEPASSQLSSNIDSSVASFMEIVELPPGNWFLARHFFGRMVARVLYSSSKNHTIDLSGPGIAAALDV